MNERLRPVRETAAWLERASERGWWKVACLLVNQVRADTVLSASLPRLAAGTQDLLDATQAPDDLEKWAIWAFGTLERFLDPGYGGSGRPTHLGGGGGSHRGQWEAAHRTLNNDLYIRPVMAWLEAQVGGLAAFHAGVERWVQRLRWFGASGPDEEFYQEDLARFLFDSGVDIEDIGREAQAAGGRVDFLLRGHMLVPVELKLWRGSGDNDRIAPARAPAQAARYVRDFQVPRGYLVVVVPRDASERLELPREAHTADGVELLIRVAEVRPRAPSDDRRTAVTRTLADLGLPPR